MGFRFFRRAYGLSRLASSTPPYAPNPFECVFVDPLSLRATEQQQHHIQKMMNNHSHITKRWHGGHHHHEHTREGESVFRLGLAADVALAAGKAVTGYLSGSTAIIADAAHSVSDIVLSGIALWSYKVARAPKDKEHPYGHGKFETLGALGISGMLLLTSGGIAWHAIDVLQEILTSTTNATHNLLAHQHEHSHSHGDHHHGIDLDHPILALSMMIISISVKEGLYWITKTAGEREGSGLMKANAWHHRADAVSSVVALIGVGGSILGVKFLDPLAGIIVSGMILKAGLETGYQSVMELVDAAVPSPVLDPIKSSILKVEGVKAVIELLMIYDWNKYGCHRLRGRRAGSSLYLDVHIEVDPFLSVSMAHNVGESVRCCIQDSHHEVAEVFIHIDPSLSQPIVDQRKSLNGAECQSRSISSMQQDIEAIVSHIILSKFPMINNRFEIQMSVEHMVHHSLQGKIMLQVQVSMPPDMWIRDAMDIAKEAEQEILKAAANINQSGEILNMDKVLHEGVKAPEH
ncbi:Metal tolerance protein C1 [Acorus gramineus]|uniref:Metal tolerance protein C1 n=1 Tax=Acorus gramineus TaxID=55184 RepID=A0AAV9BT21_ACOGR|nr:Metal tolerance protein C1 [Acorus gramineus]